MRKHFITLSVLGLLLAFCQGVAKAELVFHNFESIAGTPDGSFGWDVFSGGYAGPHSPDQSNVGVGSSTLTVNPGGLLDGASTGGDLYSFFSVANWQINLNGLDTGESFTSIAVQVAVTRGQNNATLSATDFTLGGNAPDEFVNRGVVAGAMDYYWAEWQGVAAATDFQVQISGAAPGQHTSFGGATASYFNTASVHNITAVPEPAGLPLLFCGLAGVFARRRSK